MKPFLLAASLALPLTLLPIAAGASGFAGIDIVSSEIEPDDGGSADPTALQFKFGTWINRNETLGGELRLGLGIDEDDLGRGTDVEIDRYYGAYFRGQFPNTLPVRPYGLIGLTRMETTENFPGGGSTGENYSGLSIGLGADVSLTDVVFVSVEYMRAVDSGGDEVTNLSLGLNGQNLMFCEDSARRLKRALDGQPCYQDFWLRVNHLESLHAHNAVAIATKEVEGGYLPIP